MKKKLFVAVLLDRSMSMEQIRDQAIGAFNEYISDRQREEDDVVCRASLVLFDTGNKHDLVFDAVPVSEMPMLTRETFEPRGSTPLFDAIGQIATYIDGKELREGENVALVILTDGLENRSTEVSAAACKALIEGRQKDKNWLVIYLGANQDAFREGGNVGTQMHNTMTFDAGNVDLAMKSASRATRAYGMSGSAAAASFTDAERVEAVAKKKLRPVA